MYKIVLWLSMTFVCVIGAGVGWGALCEHLHLSPLAAFGGGAAIGVLAIVAAWLIIRARPEAR